MSYIRCYDPNSSDGNSRGFVVYSDGLVKDLTKIIAETLKDPGVQKYIDIQKVKEALQDLKAKRKSLVRVKARNKLGKHEGLMIDRGVQDLMACDDFNSSMHPMGAIMEAAKKAAHGMTSPKPEGTIDERSWYKPRSFIVHCPEEHIIIDQDEMDEDIHRIVTICRKPKSLSSIMSSVLEARSKVNHEVEVLLELENTIRRSIQEGSSHRKYAGKILESVIEIVTSKHFPKDENPGSKIMEQENLVAESIRRAIHNRVAMRLEALFWQNSTPQTVVLSREEC